MRLSAIAAAALFLIGVAPWCEAGEAIRLASSPALSPDGSRLAFAWRGDIWIAPSHGGVARQLTTHPGSDAQPCFSPDGRQVAFTSDRTGTPQVYVMSAAGGFATQVTFHSEGSSVEQWFPGGESLLVGGVRDHFWNHAERLFKVNAVKRSAEELLFDAAAREADVSPDGRRILFTREGVVWWRKGYHGSQASQVWIYDLASRQFTKLLDHERGCRSPLWQPDGKGFYYVSGQSGCFNLWQRDLATGRQRQVTRFTDDSVVMPCIARDGQTIVFRHLFDFYRYRSKSAAEPERIELISEGDLSNEPLVRRVLQTATEVSFSRDGLEVAMIAGGDLWVMDTELREPQQVTSSAEEERCPAFAPDGRSILLVSDMGGQTEIWRVERADPKKYWWQNDTFLRRPVTNDGQAKSDLQWSPTGDSVAFVRGRGDLWVMGPEGQQARQIVAHWDRPSYDWSPDGKWITYAVCDKDFNRDVWVIGLEGQPNPIDLSSHPNNDGNPAWSPDGRIIAFTGCRQGTDVDLYFVFLQKEEDEADAHDRTVERAVQKIRRARLRPLAADSAPGLAKTAARPAGTPPVTSKDTRRLARTPPKVRIDVDRIAERIRQVSIPNMAEGPLCWSPDSKRVAFTATIDGKPGTYTVGLPDDLKPKLLVPHVGRSARWLEYENRLVWLCAGVPGSLTSTGEASSYRFSVWQQFDAAARYTAAFDVCWRAMRDRYYDQRLGNRNWDEIRRKYAPIARLATSTEEFGTVVSLMLGELNGSHLHFYPAEETPPSGEIITVRHRTKDAVWRETTPHLGVRFEPSYSGPGWKVRDVIAGSPADHVKTRILPGELIVSVEGKAVNPAMDPTMVLNGPPNRDLSLRVRNAQGADRLVELRPIGYERARSLLYDHWLHRARQKVAEGSAGRFGYLHVRSMDMTSFYQFERDLYAVGAGKDGLLIDVRENGGGWTTDHLLTALTQPVHALTVPRGGQPGYPQDRKVYATWNKPIVVLCNQNSFSNAEIFTHAIKTLKRGPVVGVPTAGGVISTGIVEIMDVGRLRMPTRGWFRLSDGQDMELNGAVPDYVVWPQPGDLAQGKDEQLAKAIQVLQAEVQKWSERPLPAPHKASERK